MDKVFNSIFEASLRIMLLLSVDGRDMTVDRIAEYDFMTVYSAYFGLSKQVMNGENDFGFSEYAARRKNTQAALKTMVLDGTVKVLRRENGFRYSITESGRAAAARMESEYAIQYKRLAKITARSLGNMTEEQIMDVINKASMKS